MTPSGPRNSLPDYQFGTRETEEAGFLVARALGEDLPAGDLTSDTLFGAGADARGGGTEPLVRMFFVSREPGVLCGMPLATRCYEQIDGAVSLHARQADGEALVPGEAFLEATGPVSSILKGERVALNFLQRLSAIASKTARWVAALAGHDAVLLDTRKTTPGWRHLEKYAVRVGGAVNHRRDLSDSVLLKDNHVWCLRALGRSDIRAWVAELRRRAPDAFLEVEVDTRDEFLRAREGDVDAILLDNFGPDDLRWAVERNRALSGTPPLLEASGGVQREQLAAIAATGVDRISVGALTHTVRALDISLECGELCDPAPGGAAPADHDTMRDGDNKKEDVET